jgi:drug/metabolite transporter (DMT)-like permease
MTTDKKPAVGDQPTFDAAALVAGLVTVVVWASAFVGIRAVRADLSPGALALARLLVSCTVLGAVALYRQDPLPPRRDLLAIAAYGVLWLGGYSVSLNAGSRLVDAGTAAMLVTTAPIVIAILAGIFLREGFPPRLLAGCIVGFAGSVIIGYATTQSVEFDATGVLLCLLAMLAYATAVVIQKPILSRVSPFQATWLGCAIAAVALLPFGPTLVAEITGADAGVVAWAVYLGLFPTALGFATWSFALQRTSAGRMASLTYLIPIIAILLGWILLDETPPAIAIAGGALCFSGVYLARRTGVSSRASAAETTSDEGKFDQP